MENRPQVHEYSIDGSSILPILRTCLPSALPLYRRLQSPRRTAESHIFATLSLEQLVTEVLCCFVVAFIDRSLRPETELFLYVSSHGTQHDIDCSQCRAAISTILLKAASLPVTSKLASSNAPSKYGAHLPNPRLLLAGAIEEQPARIIDSLNVLDPSLPGMNTPYAKYIFREEKLPSTSRPALSEGLTWGHMSKREDIALVISRTEIPRQIDTLAADFSVGVFDGANQPVSWGFFSADGSISSLHVEEPYRRRGIAKLVATEVARASMGEDGFGHADIGIDNVGSRRVCEGIGGKGESRVYWLRIDLDKVVQRHV